MTTQFPGEAVGGWRWKWRWTMTMNMTWRMKTKRHWESRLGSSRRRRNVLISSSTLSQNIEAWVGFLRCPETHFVHHITHPNRVRDSVRNFVGEIHLFPNRIHRLIDFLDFTICWRKDFPCFSPQDFRVRLMKTTINDIQTTMDPFESICTFLHSHHSFRIEVGRFYGVDL